MASSASSGRDDDWIWDHFQSKPKQFIAERDVYHILLENGDFYVFKPARDEDPDYERPAYVPHAELTAYNVFKCLQGNYIPNCYGILTLRGQVGVTVGELWSEDI